MGDPATPPLRRDLTALPRYVAGSHAGSRSGEGYKLSSNELPFAPTTALVDRMVHALHGVNRYPSVTNQGLVERIAEAHVVPDEMVRVGAGSISVLQQLLLATVDPDRAVVFGWRSYEAYPIVTRVCHARPVAVPLRDHRHDLRAMADRVRATRAAMVIVCNPNNPTGTTVSAGELGEFLDSIPPDCVVVLDEAYREFVTDPDVPDGVGLTRTRPNVVVLRTFSKAHGLAGLRVGYAVAPAPIAQAIGAVALPFQVDGVAEASASAALDEWPNQQRRVDAVVRERDRLVARLAANGVRAVPSQANFVWIPWPDYAAELRARLADAGISVREFPPEGARITVGEKSALEVIAAPLHHPAGT